MPAPLARGLIIAASVIVAAGIAAYENPQFREWFDRSREKITLAFNSTLDDFRPPRSKKDDASMKEDQDEKAEERRRQARQEILERGKRLEALRRRKTSSSGSDSSGSSSLNEKRSPSFDTLVDEDGKLRSDVAENNTATTSAVETQDTTDQKIRSRHAESTPKSEHSETAASRSESVDSPMLSRHLSGPSAPADEPWESQYEREMRNTWNIPLPTNRTPTASTHPSESLMDLTPTTEDFPDPDYSVPSLSGSEAGSQALGRTEYFSMPPSSRTVSRSQTRTLSNDDDEENSGSESSYYYAHPTMPLQPLQPRPVSNSQILNAPGSSIVSVAGGSDNNNNTNNIVVPLSDFESEDDDYSEIGDGIRTPASAWTEVGSTISQSDAEEMR